MTNANKIIYLNQIMFGKDKLKYNAPTLLYKYRPFD